MKGGVITPAWADCGVGGDGGSDLIGYRMVTVTSSMVGSTLAVFSAVETKTKDGRGSREQKDFIAAIERDGGIAAFAHSRAEAIDKLGCYTQGNYVVFV